MIFRGLPVFRTFKLTSWVDLFHRGGPGKNEGETPAEALPVILDAGLDVYV